MPRRLLVLCAALALSCSSTEPAPAERPARATAPADPRAAELAAVTSAVRFVHGAPPHGFPGPWALAGHRIGADALRRLDASRDHAWGLLVTHRSPAEVRYTCMLDGLQAATGASLGKLNLVHEPASADALETVVVERRTGRTLTYRLTPIFRTRFVDTDYAEFPAAARDLDALPDAAVFTVEESTARLQAPASGH